MKYEGAVSLANYFIEEMQGDSFYATGCNQVDAWPEQYDNKPDEYGVRVSVIPGQVFEHATKPEPAIDVLVIGETKDEFYEKWIDRLLEFKIAQITADAKGIANERFRTQDRNSIANQMAAVGRAWAGKKENQLLAWPDEQDQ